MADKRTKQKPRRKIGKAEKLIPPVRGRLEAVLKALVQPVRKEGV